MSKIHYIIQLGILSLLNSCIKPEPQKASISDCSYVDLKLPSGLLWATCNLGAKEAYDYGEYFSWGEVKPKKNYDIGTYKWCKDGDGYKLNKYCINDDFGTIDGKCELEKEDDAVTAYIGNPWRMPTKFEVEELIEGCYWNKIDNYKGTGISGRLGISKTNGDSIFFPSTGHRMQDWEKPLGIGEIGGVWSSSNNSDCAYLLGFDPETVIGLCAIDRSIGCPIRPVRKK